MAPILELIKKNAVPVNVMRSAAKGALPLPPMRRWKCWSTWRSIHCLARMHA